MLGGHMSEQNCRADMQIIRLALHEPAKLYYQLYLV